MGTSCIPDEGKSRACETTFRRAVVKRRIEIFPPGLSSLKRRVVVPPRAGLGNKTGEPYDCVNVARGEGVKDGVTVGVKV